MKEILTLLSSNTWHNSGPTIEIAKGKYELPNTYQIIKNRLFRWLKK